MATRQQAGDVSLYTIDSVDYLGTCRNVTLDFGNDSVEASPMTRDGTRAQIAKKGMTLRTELMSVVSGSLKVQHTDLSAISIDGVSYLQGFTGSFSGSYTSVEGSLAGTIWKDPQNVKKTYRLSGTILVPSATGGAQALLVDAASATPTDANMTVTFTINGIAITLPMTLVRASLELTDGDVQKIAIELESASPDSGTFPTAPTGTTSLLEKAFNSFKTAIAFAFTSHATEGVAFTGNCKFTSFQIGIEDGALSNVQYEFASSGAVTATAN